ncbi:MULTISPECIES: hypothetical protein [unclassified Streptomyces]|uniref:hypothetical protein n=1 Tax=unclassified Streptomyces TaxID=2593676 RepID=UPI00234A3B20|nr:hypothetical protein [Streptomyces sp. M92]WCN05060.1 F0F1 ATP synthase subunit gamma [Streptomyces sp. M92]
MTTPHLKANTFTSTDVDQLQTLMTGLVATCAAIGLQRDTEGQWRPAAPDCDGAFDNAREVIEDLSRTLNRTRRAIRRVDLEARARHRLTSGTTSMQ